MAQRKFVSKLMLKQAYALFDDEEERSAFIEALQRGDSREQAIIILEDRPEIRTFPRLAPTPWQPEFVERIAEDFRPGKHPSHEKGAYYCLDLSSVFCASAMLAIPGPIERALDLCAAPGGKAIFAWRAHRPEFLACNEAIRKRAGTLIANLERCKVTSSVVWSADPSVWARKFPECFDLLLVDAPCSGQSLIAKGDEAEGCWSEQMIDMCVGRQRRILGNGVKTLRPGGHLVYSTCTYAKQENEKVVAWLLEQFPDLEAVEVPHLAAFRSRFGEFPTYRLFPHQGIGAGGFVALIRRKPGEAEYDGDVSELKGWWKFGDVREAKPSEMVEKQAPEPFEKPRPKRQRRPLGRPEYKPKRTQKSRRGRNRPG